MISSRGSMLFNRISTIPSTYPFTFGVLFSGIKTSFSDLVVQKVVEQREYIDWNRNGAFALFGFIYLGGVQYTLYVPIFGTLFPNAARFASKSIKEKIKDVRGMFHLFAQVFIDQCIHHPFMYFPAFYCTKEFVLHYSKEKTTQQVMNDAITNYRNNMYEDLDALWRVWVPSTMINFAFMPMYGRIPFVACVSLLWTMILSSMRGGDVSHGETMAGGAVTGATLTMMEESIVDDHNNIFTSNVQLDRNMNHIILTASGQDTPGIIPCMTRAVSDIGGNVTHSKMVRLGHDLIMLMHISLPPSSSSSSRQQQQQQQQQPPPNSNHNNNQRLLLEHVRTQQQLKHLHVQMSTISRRNTGTYDVPVMGIRIRCIGADKPGMLASITESLENAGLTIENISTQLKVGSSSNSSGSGGSSSGHHHYDSGSDSTSNSTNSSRSSSSVKQQQQQLLQQQQQQQQRLDFVVEADCVTSRHMDQHELEDMVAELSALKQTLYLDVVDLRVQRLRPHHHQQQNRRSTTRTSN